MHLVFIHTHPVQYQVPIYRMLNAREDVNVTVLYFSDHSVKGGQDRGFGQAVTWDVPMLEGYEHQFLSNEGPGNEGTGFRSYTFSGFREVFKTLTPDAVILPGYGFNIYWQAAREAARLGIPVAVRPECVDGAQPNRPVWKTLLRSVSYRWRFFRHIDLFLYTGHFSRLEGERFGFSGDRLQEAFYCIDTHLLESQLKEWAPKREHVREELGMKPEDLGIVFMAKFIDWKHPKLIVDAIETCEPPVRERLFPILVGSGPDFDMVRARAEEVCGEGRFSCPGFVNQSELCKYYAAADVAVLPSKRSHESWGLVVNEAMTCGLPVAVSDGVGSRVDLIEGKSTGSIFSDGDAEGLGEMLSEWAGNPEKRQQEGMNARLLIKGYSSDKAAEGILEGIKRILSPSGATS